MQQLTGLAIPFAGSAWEGSPMSPYQGDCFTDGSHNFTHVAALLQQEQPQHWSGAAAHAHNSAKSQLIAQAQTMAALDQEFAALVKDHAHVVTQAQLGTGIEQAFLLALYPVILGLESHPTTFNFAMTAAITAAATSITAAVGLLAWCLGSSIQTLQAVDNLEYSDVIKAAQTIIDQHQPATTNPVDTTSTGPSAHDSTPANLSSPPPPTTHRTSASTDHARPSDPQPRPLTRDQQPPTTSPPPPLLSPTTPTHPDRINPQNSKTPQHPPTPPEHQHSPATPPHQQPSHDPSRQPNNTATTPLAT
ncbi:EspA/EspE family type VII secretion system effector, partial [Mycobacterium sp. 050134]|uniref:EspA/EspE family type VII secretion system effector n=1 Tax=Mycobacterium sp. 050134 TaxID=3096111 RepID=UPI002ED91C7C